MPPSPPSWRVDFQDGMVVVTVGGALDAGTGSALYDTLAQFLELQPAAVVVELSGMTLTEPAAADVFPAIARDAEAWPGTPLLLCAPDPATATLIGERGGEEVPVIGTVAEGRAAVAGRDEHISEIVRPVPGAARQARDAVTGACLRWDLPHIISSAALVVSELVANAVEHTRTVMTVEVRLRPRFLYVAVHDGGHGIPVIDRYLDAEARRGHGLRLVDRVSHRWGHVPRPDGKVVWAAIDRKRLAW